MPSPVSYVGAAVAACVGALLQLAPAGPATDTRAVAPDAARVRHVVAVSVDGLNPRAIRELGPRRAPVLHRLRAHGAGTLNARTARELTITLPNHTGMVTGRRVAAGRHGHGVTWNDERLRPRTVQEAAGHPVRSVFTVVHAAGRRSAVFASKPAFRLFARSWPTALDRTVVREHNGPLVGLAQRDLRRHGRAFTLVHLSLPDIVGHRRGFMSPAYLDAVARADTLVGRLLSTVRHDDDLRGSTTLVLTADHGGSGGSHDEPGRASNYRVPFLVWGPGVADGASLYRLNPEYADPGARRTRYGTRRQPVRNGDLANLATDLLGLPGVRGSEFDADQHLDVR